MALTDTIARYTPPPSLEPSGKALQDWLDEAAKMGQDRCDNYALYDEFYDGKHRTKLRARARRYLEEMTGVPFCENFTQPVIDTLSERLEVIGFSSSEATVTKDAAGNEETADPAAQKCEQWWQQGRMDGLQGRVHNGALRRGDEFLIVDWDDDQKRPVFVRQLPHQCKVVYSEDEPDTVAYAVKCWNTGAVSVSNPAGARVTRLNIYWPNRIERWFQSSSGGEWAHWVDVDEDGELEPWPEWWTTTVDMDGEPFGAAMIHFRHMPDDTGYGRSRVRMAIPFQMEQNKTVADLSDLVDNHALPQDYVTGVAGEISLERFAGVWKVHGDNAKVGRLEASETANLLNAIEGVLSRLARRMRIPMHLLTGGTPPSGEALKTSESGLVATAKDCQVEFGNAWEDALLLGLRLDAAFGSDTPAELAADLRIETQWANPETRSDEADLRAAMLKKQLGVSKHTILTEMGYDPEKEAEHRLAETEEEAQALGKALGSPGFGD